MAGVLFLLGGPPLVITFAELDAPARGPVYGLEPGPRSTAHADVSTCSACHVSQRRIADDRCLACHATISARITSQRGLHGRAAAKGLPCARCHREHRGDGPELSGWPAFTEGGRMVHEETGFALLGAHLRVPCVSCHSKSPVQFDPPPTQCGAAACHGPRDPHGGKRPQCENCHAPTGWKREDA